MISLNDNNNVNSLDLNKSKSEQPKVVKQDTKNKVKKNTKTKKKKEMTNAEKYSNTFIDTDIYKTITYLNTIYRHTPNKKENL